MIKKILRDFEKILIQKNVKSYYLLQDGLDKKEIFTLLHQYFDNIPDEIYDIYQWKNGTQDIPHIAVGKLWIIPMYYFINLNKAVRTYYRQSLKEKYFEKNFFPLFASGGGELLLIDMAEKNIANRQIYYFYLGNTEPDFDVMISYYDNFEKMLETTIECFNRGIYFVNSEDGSVDCNYDLEYKLSKELNPNSDYWKIRDD
jgi:hypothetical protein